MTTMLPFQGYKPKAIGIVRARLGISLREAHDFLVRNPHNWEERLEAEASNKTASWVSPEDKIRDLSMNKGYVKVKERLYQGAWSATLELGKYRMVAGPFGPYPYSSSGAILNILYGLGVRLFIVEEVRISAHPSDEKAVRILYYGAVLADVYSGEAETIVKFGTYSCLSDSLVGRRINIQVTTSKD
jgi:hypothetical protein